MTIRNGAQQTSKRAAAVHSRSAAPVLRRQCACGGDKQHGPCQCERADEPVVARMPGHALADIAIHAERPLQSVRGVLEREPGEPLAGGVRDWAEGALGHDLGGVRIHAGHAAALSANAIDAAAYTVGQHIVFAPGAYAPGTSAGRRLIAHELAHTLQQGTVSRFDGLSIGSADAPAEHDAESIAARATSDGSTRSATVSTSGTVARAPAEGDAQPEQSADGDKCAGYEKDCDSMAWSIARHVYRSLGRAWPGVDKGSCKESKSTLCPVSGDLRMGDGMIVPICYDPAKNTASTGLLEVDSAGHRRVLAQCELSYQCPETWQVEFSGGCVTSKPSNP